MSAARYALWVAACAAMVLFSVYRSRYHRKSPIRVTSEPLRTDIIETTVFEKP